MRMIFIFGNMLGLFCVALLAYLNLSFRSTPPDPLLNNTPKLKDFNIQIENTIAKGVSTDFSKLLNDNVFSPYRAKEEGDVFSSLKVTGMELIGIISYGDIAGAIIADKGASQAVQPQGPRSSVLPGTNKQNKQAGRPQFYKLNEVLPNGFTLKEVNSDSVLLSRAGEQIVLQLDFKDEGSKMRTEEGVKLSTKSPENNIQIQEVPRQPAISGGVVLQSPQPKTKSGTSLPQSKTENGNDAETSQAQDEKNVDKNAEQLKPPKKHMLRPGEVLR